MKNYNIINVVLLLMLSILTSSCFNSSFESARMLKKGNFDAKGYATANVASEKNETSQDREKTGTFGVGMGYGISDRFNVKLNLAYNTIGVGMVELSPKFSIVQGKFAAALPIAINIGEEDASSPFIRPQVWLTAPSTNNKTEFTLGIRSEISFEKGSTPTIGATLGAGFSNNLDKWAIRPEIGIAANLEDFKAGQIFNFGIGVNYVFQGKKTK